LLGELCGRADDGDRVGEGGFDQDGSLGHWDRYRYARDGWGLMQVYPKSFWEYVNVIPDPYRHILIPNLYSS